MSINANYILRFCALIDITSDDKKLLIGSGHFKEERISHGDANWEPINNQYYPSFRPFITNEEVEQHSFGIIGGGVNKQYTTLQTNEASGPISFTITDADVFFFLDHLSVVTMDVRITDSNLSLDSLSAFVNVTRNYGSRIVNDQGGETTMLHIIQDDVLKIAHHKNRTAGTSNSLTPLRGSKMKIYQCLDIGQEYFEHGDRLLFEVGTGIRIGSMASSSASGHTQHYFEEISSASIKVYNNWQCLCLFDSFTMLSGGGLTEFSRPTWSTTYFRIYVFNLLLKYYLFSLTTQDLYNMGKLKKRRNELNEIIYRYNVERISYNFLPNLIHQSIRKGLEVDDEMETLSTRIERMTALIKEKNDGLLQGIGFVLSLFVLLPSNWRDIVPQNNGDPMLLSFDKPNLLLLIGKAGIVLALLLFFNPPSKLKRLFRSAKS